MSNVTILIPTANRPEFLVRQLSYYALLHSPYPIVVADSSDIKVDIPVWIQKELDITHLKIPRLGISHGMRQANQHIRTKYVVYSGDDDFLVPSGLRACADFLDHHPDYSAAHGIGWAFAMGAYGEWVVYYDQPVVEEDTALARLTHYIRNYDTTIFSVTRKEVWLEAYCEDCEKELDQVFGDEVLPSCMIATLGKVAWLQVPHLVRQDHPGRCWGKRGYEWITTPNWVQWYRIFIANLAATIAGIDGIPKEAAAKAVDQAYDCYMRRYWGRYWRDYTTQHNLLGGFRNLVRRISPVMPLWLKLGKLLHRPQVNASQVFIPKEIDEIIYYCKRKRVLTTGK